MLEKGEEGCGTEVVVGRHFWRFEGSVVKILCFPLRFNLVLRAFTLKNDLSIALNCVALRLPVGFIAGSDCLRHQDRATA